MTKTQQHTDDHHHQINQIPIRLDSKWLKTLIGATGSIESALILSECFIYHHNKYRSFTINDQQCYGLLTSASELQRDYHISYKRAGRILKNMVTQGWLELHQQGFIHNQKFYTPSEKSIDMLYRLHFENTYTGKEENPENDPLRPNGKSTLLYRQKTYKDKNKGKKNNSLNSLWKEDKLLENQRDQTVKTVVFDFKNYAIDAIECEGEILDYFTAKQNEAINTTVFCYGEMLDIKKFNQILNQSDVKKEVNDFKQLVTWAYIESEKPSVNKTTDVIEDNTINLSNQVSPQIQSLPENLNDHKISIDENLQTTYKP